MDLPKHLCNAQSRAKIAGMLTDSSQLVGVSEAAETLGVDRATITRWARQGKLTPVNKLPGSNGPYLFSRATIAHLAAQRRASR